MKTSKDFGTRALSALGWSYGGAVGRAIGQVLVQLLLARFLGPEAFGQATAAFFVLALGWQLAEGGFGAALIQKAEVSEHDVGHALACVLLLSGSIGGLVVAASPWLAQWLGGPHLTALIMASGALIPLQALSNIPVSLMRRNLDMRRSQLIYLGGYFVAYAVIGLPMAWAGAGPWTLVVAFGVHSLINLLASYAMVRHTLRPRWRGDAALRRFGLHVTGTNAANWAIDNVDRLMVNRFWGSRALGEYTAAFTMSRAPASLLVSSVQAITFASASRIQDDPARLSRAYLSLLALVTLVTCPLFALLAMHADAVVRLVYGHRWEKSGPLFAAFCAGLPFFAVLAISGPMLWAVNAVRQEMIVQVTGVVVIFIGFFLLAGAPLAEVVWLVPAMYALRMGWIYRALASRLLLSHRRSARAVAAGLGLGLLAIGVSLATGHWLHELPAALVSGGISLIVSWALLRAWPRGVLAPELVELLQNRSSGSRVLAMLCRMAGLEPR